MAANRPLKYLHGLPFAEGPETVGASILASGHLTLPHNRQDAFALKATW